MIFLLFSNIFFFFLISYFKNSIEKLLDLFVVACGVCLEGGGRGIDGNVSSACEGVGNFFFCEEIDAGVEEVQV